MLGDRYSYAKKNKILLPIAWIHRIVIWIFDRNSSILEKFKMYVNARSILKRHRELLDWLEL